LSKLRLNHQVLV